MINITGYHSLTQIYESACTLVCRAHSEKDGKPVILKIMREDYPAPARITRYRQEYEITNSLCLEGVIRAYGIEKYKNGLMIIFEDFGGESLNKIQQAKKLALADLIDITVKIVKPLGEIHGADIIHKDINPSNIVCNLETGQLKIIDFNFASVLSRENPTIQNPEAIEGALAYISPEQTGRMNRSLDYRTDFYSLGVMLYELLSGQLPFASSDPSEMVYSHLAVLPEPLHKLDPGIPKAVSDIVMKLLSKNAEDRYQSAKGIQADLETCLGLVRFGDITETFSLGTRDIPERFDIPQKLYGREQELEILAWVFGRVTRGHREMMLVSGYSGIGKTALVHEIYKPLTRQKGYFISGKFGQFQKNIPYSALVNAFRELSHQILTESETRLEQWKHKFMSAFGTRGRVLTDVIPELELIAGAQPDVPELPPTESRNRFNMVFQNFIRIFPDPEHPLVIFLDDLQWADSATLNLMELMMTDYDMRFLLLIGAYRDNEIHLGHPLMNFLNTLKKKSVFFHQVSLFPLRLEHVTILVTDTLHTSGESAMPLAELLIRKTRGNPFFVSQFLKTLYHENLLVFTHEGVWQWNIDDIEKMGITDNVTDLMIRKMEKMPETTRHALRMAACVGNRFDLNTLFIICEQSANETFDSLLPAIREELITPTSAPEMSHRDAIDAKPIFFSFKFLHDRIQQAAYALIDDEKKKSVHLGIGRMLMANLSEKEQAERLFELADHLNQGQDLITSDREKTELARLNLNAARKAKSSAAYGAGLEYLKSGMKKIGQAVWTDRYDLALALSMERAELEYLNGNYKDSELWINLIWKKAKSPLEKAGAYALLIIQYTVLGRNEDAIQAAAKALELFGVHFPGEKDLNTALDAEIAEVKARTGNRPIGSLLELPEMTDPENKALMKVLMTVHTPVYFTNKYKLYMWVLARMTSLSLRHGHVPESSKGYASYGNILCTGMEEYRTGYEFGMLGIKLSEKYSHQSLKCKNCLIMSMFISHWVAHIKDSEVFSNDGHQAGLESGEFQFVGYILAYGKTINIFHQGKTLNELLEDMQKYLVFNQNVQHHLPSDIILGCRRVIRNLCGKTRDRLSFDTDEGTEAEYLRKCSEHQSFAAICLYRTIRAQALYIYGLSSYALESIMEAHELLGYIRGVFTTAEHNFYYSLILADLYPNASPENQGQYRGIMENNQEQMKIWAQTCPENFLHKYYLVAAETARISGRDEDVSSLFDKAIALAEKNEFVQDQALANELAGKFWFSKGWDEFGHQHEYMKRAYYGYRLWGADRKTRHLGTQYPWILNRTSQGDDPAPRFSSNTTGAESLDLAAIIKASQAISGEIKLKELLKKLMYILVESAGAEKGFLISGKKHGLAVDARYLDQHSEVLPESVPVDECSGLSPAIARYVARTLENVVLSNASQEGMFTRDSYVMKNMPKSVCCLPVLLHGNLTGVLYLENNQAVDAFTPGRLEILKLLASQAAISMENARLYTDLEEQAEHLRVAEKKYRSIFENAVEGIFQVSPEGRFMSINPALARIAGYDSPEEMMSSVTNVTKQLYVNPDDRQLFYKLLGEHGEVIGFETRVYRKDRTLRWASVSARSVKDADNNIVYTEGFITDITEHIEKEHAEKEREIAEQANKKIMASIRYASMIQNSILPNPEDIRAYLPQSFFIWEPRDIVGGDIYYTDFFEGGFILALVDCTGHGVPGAFMTMIASSGLKRIIKDEGCRDPAEILKQLNFIVKTTLHQDKKYALSDDGLDAAVCLAETGTSSLTFAGARLPLVYFRNEEVHVVKGDRQSIGYKSSDQGFNFTNHTICIEKGMLFYMYTDGFTDQLGGEKHHSFGSRRFRELLKKIVRLPFEKQREIVMQAFEEYRGENERQDDVTVVGFGF